MVVDLHSLFCFIYNIKINLQSKGKTNEGRCSSEKYGITKQRVGGKKISSKQFISNIKIKIVVATILSTDYVCVSQHSKFFVLLLSFNPYNNPTREYELPSTQAQILHLTLLLGLCHTLQVEN